MKEKLIQMLVTMLLSVLTPELMKEFADMVLDWVEDKVLGTASTIDDKLVLPICDMIRATFGIPDGD